MKRDASVLQKFLNIFNEQKGTMQPNVIEPVRVIEVKDTEVAACKVLGAIKRLRRVRWKDMNPLSGEWMVICYPEDTTPQKQENTDIRI